MKRKSGRLAEYDSAISERIVLSLRAQASSYDEAFATLTADPSVRFKESIDEELHELIARNPDSAAARMAASEVRRREAWQTPARWSLMVSIAALVLSIFALIRTL